ncbi:hypothetical protein [Nocardioides lijunqiniae]|uniref:hypothetical protein n=1 Tax=Nocardioides lijunqiniae TaxID=2760832 RepID=UPI001877B332|nr:hypothetical protein [Nocardioides lijunqiniae]
MGDAHRSPETQARQRFVDALPIAEAWVRAGGEFITPVVGSQLDEDVELENWRAWHLAHFSLSSGTHHLLAAVRYLLEFGPAALPIHSLMRTALWGGAQGLWVLHPVEPGERAARAAQVLGYSVTNHRKWLDTFSDVDPEGSEARAALRARLVGLSQELGSQGPNQHQVVRWAGEHVFGDQPGAVAEVEQGWRELGAVAHAVPWELSRRPGQVVAGDERVSVRAVRGSSAELEGVLSHVLGILEAGWGVFEERASTAAVDPT